VPITVAVAVQKCAHAEGSEAGLRRQRATTAASSSLVAPVPASAASSCWLLLLLDSFPVRGWRWGVQP